MLTQYRKKIGDIGKNLENTRKIREELNLRFDRIEKAVDSNGKRCKDGAEDTNDHLDRITLKYKEDIVDLKASTEGFSRELIR